MKVQSKLGSFMEANVNTFSGFLISWGVWMWIVGPLFEIPTHVGQGFAITCIFTVSSLIRSYIVRRIANYFQERKMERAKLEASDIFGDCTPADRAHQDAVLGPDMGGVR